MKVLMFILLTPFFLIPTIIAFYKHHPNKKYIAILNVVGGWTVIGWIVSLVWVLSIRFNKPTAKDKHDE